MCVRLVITLTFHTPITLLQIEIESLIVSHIKNLIHICLEPHDQDPNSMTFRT